jgi:hypothetical protein
LIEHWLQTLCNSVQRKRKGKVVEELENDFILDPINLLATCCKFKVERQKKEMGSVA